LKVINRRFRFFSSVSYVYSSMLHAKLPREDKDSKKEEDKEEETEDHEEEDRAGE